MCHSTWGNDGVSLWRSAIMLDAPHIKFLEDEFDRPQKHQQAEIRNDMISSFPNWWKGQTQAADIDEHQLLQCVHSWLSSYAAARKKAAVEQN